jgi:hypothetical protein
MRVIALALVLFAVPAPAIAQGSENARNREIEREILRMRELLRAGKVVTSHVRLRVRLKNGNRIQGVVKNGKLIEKVDGLHFVTADSQTRGAGVRLWYYDDTNSYIFLPFHSVASYKVGERLSGSQVLAIEEKIDSDRRRAEQARKEYLAKREAERRGESGELDEQARREEELRREAGELAKEEEKRKLMALLDEYPPEDGWGRERREEIELLKASAGVFPDQKGKRFLEIFADWNKAFRLRNAEKREAKKALPGDNGG